MGTLGARLKALEARIGADGRPVFAIFDERGQPVNDVARCLPTAERRHAFTITIQRREEGGNDAG